MHRLGPCDHQVYEEKSPWNTIDFQILLIGLQKSWYLLNNCKKSHQKEGRCAFLQKGTTERQIKIVINVAIFNNMHPPPTHGGAIMKNNILVNFIKEFWNVLFALTLVYFCIFVLYNIVSTIMVVTT